MLRDILNTRSTRAEAGKHTLDHALPFQLSEMVGQTTVGSENISSSEWQD